MVIIRWEGISPRVHNALFGKDIKAYKYLNKMPHKVYHYYPEKREFMRGI